MKTIESPTNPLVKRVAQLRSRDGRRAQGRIIIDGARGIALARRAGVAIEQLFVPRAVAEAASGRNELDMSEATTEVILLSDAALAKVAYGERQEMVAIATPPRRTLADLSHKTDPCVAVLEGVEKPGNLGAVIRNADGAGIDAVIVMDGRTDLYNPNAIRASLGTIFTTLVCEASFPDFVQWAKQNGIGLFLATVDGDLSYTQADLRGPSAIVLGSEAKGLSARWRSLPHRAIRVPMRGQGDSLNVSATAAILFYHATNQNHRTVPL